MKYLACLLVMLLGWSSVGQAQLAARPILPGPRLRVILDNDFSGDPDGLFALAHLLLSPSVEVRGIIGSHLKVGDGFDPTATQADNAAAKATELLRVLHRPEVPVLAGANVGMATDSTPVQSAAVRFLIAEAQRPDPRPLYVLCGAGLTEIASAALTEPAIAQRLTLVWIGGPEYSELAVPPPGYAALEYNLAIDVPAARAVFNRTQLPLWQVPRDAYRQVLLSHAVLQTRVQPQGALGRYLATTLDALLARLGQYGLHVGETYILGDSPLVLLTALQSSFEPDPSSSEYALRPAPTLTPQGTYAYHAAGRLIRVYRRLDTALLLSDFFAKLELRAR